MVLTRDELEYGSSYIEDHIKGQSGVMAIANLQDLLVFVTGIPHDTMMRLIEESRYDQLIKGQCTAKEYTAARKVA